MKENNDEYRASTSADFLGTMTGMMEAFPRPFGTALRASAEICSQISSKNLNLKINPNPNPAAVRHVRSRIYPNQVPNPFGWTLGLIWEYVLDRVHWGLNSEWFNFSFIKIHLSSPEFF